MILFLSPARMGLAATDLHPHNGTFNISEGRSLTISRSSCTLCQVCQVRWKSMNALQRITIGGPNRRAQGDVQSVERAYSIEPQGLPSMITFAAYVYCVI